MRTKTAVATTHQNEMDLLLCCARTHVDTDTAIRLRALAAQNIDWEAFAQLTRGHGVMPLVYRGLADNCPELVPASLLTRMRDAVRLRIHSGLMLFGELYQLLDLFTTHNIPAIPFKGPTLGLVAYGDPTLRESGDLDILVHERDMNKAKALLLARGYFPGNPREYSEAQIIAIRELYHHEVFYRSETKLMVELHWRLAEYPLLGGFSNEALWDNCSNTRMRGHDVRMIPLADLLLFLCAHGAKHRWWYLKWHCDVAELLRSHPDIDWTAVLATAKATGNVRMLLLGVLLAHELVGAPVPEDVLQQAHASRTIVMLANDVRQHLGVVSQYVPVLLDLLRFQIHTKERILDRSRLVLQRLITPADGDWGAISLPPVLSFLYWLVRPFRLLKRYGQLCLKQIFGESA